MRAARASRSSGSYDAGLLERAERVVDVCARCQTVIEPSDAAVGTDRRHPLLTLRLDDGSADPPSMSTTTDARTLAGRCRRSRCRRVTPLRAPRCGCPRPRRACHRRRRSRRAVARRAGAHRRRRSTSPVGTTSRRCRCSIERRRGHHRGAAGRTRPLRGARRGDRTRRGRRRGLGADRDDDRPTALRPVRHLPRARARLALVPAHGRSRSCRGGRSSRRRGRDRRSRSPRPLRRPGGTGRLVVPVASGVGGRDGAGGAMRWSAASIAVTAEPSSSCGKCMGEMVSTDDVLDARFIAALWPLASAGWPNDERAAADVSASTTVFAAAGGRDRFRAAGRGARASTRGRRSFRRTGLRRPCQKSERSRRPSPISTTHRNLEKMLAGERATPPTLERIRELFGLLGDPERQYPVVHVTGTNGKTSTSRADQRAAGGARFVDRYLHESAPRLGDGAHAVEWRADQRSRLRRGDGATGAARTVAVGDRPDVVRTRHRGGVRLVRRSGRRRGGCRGRPGRHVGRDQRGRRNRGGHHFDRARPPRVSRRHTGVGCRGESRDHQRRRDGGRRLRSTTDRAR